MPSDDHSVSRRGFLSASAIGGALPHLDSAIAPAQPILRPASASRQLSPNLFVLEDTCNVYLIRDGHTALLIDFGSGAILDHLPALVVTSVEWILYTHHHRDQAQGDILAPPARSRSLCPRMSAISSSA